MEKEKPQECPKCGEKSLWHNIYKPPKYAKESENYKCGKCDYIRWLPKSKAPKPAEPKPEGYVNHSDRDPIKILADQVFEMGKQLTDIQEMLVKVIKGEYPAPSTAGELPKPKDEIDVKSIPF